MSNLNYRMWKEQRRLLAYGLTLARYSTTKESVYIGNDGVVDTENGANVGIGAGVMTMNATSGLCVAVGRNAMYWALGAANCVAIGASAMQNAQNPGVGVLPVGTVLGAPTDCTAVGSEAGRDWQGIVGATAVGRISQAKTTTGTGNTSVGDASLRDNTTGAENVAVGYGAAAYNITGNRLVALGQAACYRSTASSSNIGVGMESLEFNQGSYNVGVGDRAGRALLTATHMVMLGHEVGTNVLQKTDATNGIVLGAGAYGTKSNQVVLGNSSVTETLIRGKAAVNGTDPLGQMDVIGNLTALPTSDVYGQIEITGSTNRAKRLALAYNTTMNVGCIQALTNGASYDPLLLQGNGGNVGIGIDSASITARLHLAAGAAAAGRAPIKLTAGTNLTTPENGAFEFDGTNLFFTAGGTRRTITWS